MTTYRCTVCPWTGPEAETELHEGHRSHVLVSKGGHMQTQGCGPCVPVEPSPWEAAKARAAELSPGPADREECRDCVGTGRTEEIDTPQPCETCGGTGLLDPPQSGAAGPEHGEPCPDCEPDPAAHREALIEEYLRMMGLPTYEQVAKLRARIEELEAQVATFKLGDADQVKERDDFIDRVVAEGRRMSEHDRGFDHGIAIDRFTDWIEEERPPR